MGAKERGTLIFYHTHTEWRKGGEGKEIVGERGKERVGHGSKTKDSQCFYEVLIDFLE